MTLDQAEAARQHAVAMFKRFGDEASAAVFDSLDAQQYADRQGIEISASNPKRSPRGYPARFSTTPSQERKTKTMAKQSSAVIELEDTIKDIYDVVQESGSTRADMEESLDRIASLCTDAVPELDESEIDTDEEDGDEE